LDFGILVMMTIFSRSRRNLQVSVSRRPEPYPASGTTSRAEPLTRRVTALAAITVRCFA
jgi:hypothetical protein